MTVPKRGVFDVLRRGVDNTIANWPLVLIRLGEVVLFGLMAVVAVIAAIVPLLVSVGIEVSGIDTPDDIESAMFALMERWILLVWIFVAIAVLLLLFVAIHAFVEAGSTRVYVDAERMAGPAMAGRRSRFRAFSMERWLAGAKNGWWTVFWIYNLAWGVAGLILLIPLLPTIGGMLLLRERPPAAVATGCAGLILTGMLFIVVGAVTGMWVNRAIAEWAVRGLGARESLATGWSAFRRDLGRHVLIFLAVFITAVAGSSFFASFSFFAAFGDAFGGNHGMFNLATLPLRIVGSLLNSAFSAMVSAWYLASYSALATE
ncbi:MAG TPA: hypothetical protein VFV49_03160 [Thermoanaerobaculia bacterium]|nr:hypothetical protein [Thermoanaerobaculia bacterium]